ncbi:MAG TPA: hypothetical protein VJ742_07765 [Nitrososphaera sp.]|nr:hypothetical protein [Nitrososphaera sp.]
MKERHAPARLKEAFDKSLDLLGERSKRSLLAYLEKELGITFREQDPPSMEELESALRSILGQGAHIITNEFHKNLANPGKSSGKRPISGRQGKSLA